MIALSTSFAAGRYSDGDRLMAALESFKITGVELDYRILEPVFHQMRPLLKQSRLSVVSIHNFFPVPGIIKSGQGSGDLFYLSHPDREERHNAIKWTRRTIEHANDLETGVVVLHCGRVEIEPGIESGFKSGVEPGFEAGVAFGINQLHAAFQSNRIDTEEAQDFILKAKEYRDRRKPKYLDSLLFSLDRLLGLAERYDVVLGLENRYHYHELPGPDDFSLIFKEFDGAPIGYWHDTGHAHVNEMLGMVEPESLLSKNRDRLVGVHLHDAVGLNDHLPPGAGNIDFSKIMPQIKPDTIKVIELKPGTPDKDITAGIKYVATLIQQTTTKDKKERYSHRLTGKQMNRQTDS